MVQCRASLLHKQHKSHKQRRLYARPIFVYPHPLNRAFDTSCIVAPQSFGETFGSMIIGSVHTAPSPCITFESITPCSLAAAMVSVSTLELSKIESGEKRSLVGRIHFTDTCLLIISTD